MPGICSGIRDFFGLRAKVANTEMVLTWDSDQPASKTRRNEACGTRYCKTVKADLQAMTGDKTLKVSCDEFPFAATEEGGKFLTTLNANPGRVQRTCVPDWQQTLQGNCNRKTMPFHST